MLKGNIKGKRNALIEIGKEEFKKAGYNLIDKIADFIDTIEDRPVTPGMSLKDLQNVLGSSPLPEYGVPVEKLLSDTSDLVIDHSLLNGHPKFMGYITSSATSIGALADLLAAAVNPNVGAQILS